MGNSTDLGHVHGPSSSNEVTHHWLTQRGTAIANLALMTWLITSLVTGDFSNLDSVKHWLSQPVAAVPMLLLVISMFTHLRLGLTVLIEDYVHDEATKLGSLLMLTFFVWGGLITALFAITSIALGGAGNASQ